MWWFVFGSQEFSDQGDGGYGANFNERKPPRTKNKIREALHFMRNQHFEVRKSMESKNK